MIAYKCGYCSEEIRQLNGHWLLVHGLKKRKHSTLKTCNANPIGDAHVLESNVKRAQCGFCFATIYIRGLENWHSLDTGYNCKRSPLAATMPEGIKGDTTSLSVHRPRDTELSIREKEAIFEKVRCLPSSKLIKLWIYNVGGVCNGCE